eukprot:CAMPEP_0197663614 /NCGR_PEP_ID=MMETSP1338-20131121/58139_1 /TAXON_ID=43686 ORGANISM="Pelagodinium beii, Strain RCC1491" /NCGR_SAMPLE_ID=MMETSP1338 /ASSEMBLY_ACC=CAM_ASM_000754 /LENGTH=90 /DNA_ID=CAMNT_0043242087 /DNA_START=113 /DNA_END=386 /DNA_ORIENTATION=-
MTHDQGVLMQRPFASPAQTEDALSVPPGECSPPPDDVLCYVACQDHADGQQMKLGSIDTLQKFVQAAARVAGLQEPLQCVASQSHVSHAD